MVMRRGLKSYISLRALKSSLYVPIIVYKFDNWYSFLSNYIGFKNEAKIYKFRNSIRIKTNEGIDSITIAVIFIKKEYGEVKNNSTVIDIGANIGVYSIFAATTSKNTIVYAYEPMPKSYKLLLENIRINSLGKNIFPFQQGVCAKKEKRKLFLASASPFHSLYGAKEGRKYLEIDCVSLKDIFDDNKIKECDILKLDCEGAEFEILYNTPKEYLEKIKEIRLEYHNQVQVKKDYNIKSLMSFLQKGGFKTIKFRKNKHSGNAWCKREPI
jgi:FkbM family methyltransferase